LVLRYFRYRKYERTRNCCAGIHEVSKREFPKAQEEYCRVTRQDQISAHRGSGFWKSRGQRVGQLDSETPKVVKRDVLLSGAAVSRFHILAYRGSSFRES
jgi:hypothetical protein